MVELADIELGEVISALDDHQVSTVEGFICEQITPVVDLNVELVYCLNSCRYLASDGVHFEFLEEGQDGLQVIHIAQGVNVGVLEGLQGEDTVGEGQPPELSLGPGVGGGLVPAVQRRPLSAGQIPAAGRLCLS
ncbi:hypothetical protein E2C01_016345 [Portunus trituberculatus]|uniref:Uncharacterized protein n=1 Tax=Portunus trituberculatus TaxID=210409 RepID=A0A5B7DNW0_PORTR|nr:hypothetical protein [Portunus trituberculatus]